MQEFGIYAVSIIINPYPITSVIKLSYIYINELSNIIDTTLFIAGMAIVNICTPIVRVFFDESGSPSLLSFAQFGSAYTGNNTRQRERAMDHARRQAEYLADMQLTEFINSTITIEESSDIGEEEISRIFFRADGTKVREEIRNCIDRYSSSSRTTGADTMVGRSTVCSRTLNHPAGHQIAVVIRRWSFAKLEAELGLQEKRTNENKTELKKEDAGVRQGRTYDF